LLLETGGWVAELAVCFVSNFLAQQYDFDCSAPLLRPQNWKYKGSYFVFSFWC